MPLARDLGIDSVLDVVTNTFHIEGEERGTEYYFPCISPDHTDHRPSCSVNLDTGLFFCFSCGAGGDLLALGSLALGVPKAHVERMLVASPTQPGYMERLWRRIEKHLQREPIPQVEELPGPYGPEPLDYLRQRGYNDATLRRWGCRHVKQQRFTGPNGDYVIRNYIAIPVINHLQVQLGWCYRAINPYTVPRYLYTPGMKIKEIWFGSHLHHDKDKIVIVEGALDCMWLDQCGYPTLAMLGSAPSENKVNWLKRFGTVTIFADRDAAGAQAVLRIGKSLQGRVGLWVARYPRYVEGKDPQDLEQVDVEIAIERAIPYVMWKRGQTGKGDVIR